MGLFTKRLITGLAAALALTGGAFAADSVLDDFEGGTNQNKFGAYWYFATNTLAKTDTSNACDNYTYSGSLNKHPDKLETVTNAEKDGYTLKFKGGYGADTISPKNGSYSGVLKFANLLKPYDSDVNTNSWADIYPGVMMGTQLTSDSLNGVGADFASATAVKFWINISASIAQVGFKVEVADQLPQNASGWTDGDKENPNVKKGCPADASYQMYIPNTSPDEWREVTIPLETGKGKLERATWESTFKPYTWNKTRATKIAWFVEGDKGMNGDATDGLVAVDDIRIIGYEFKDKWLCAECVKATENPTPPTGAVLFTSFDALAAEGNISVTQNKFGEYWYAYTDVEARGTQGAATVIDEGQWNDPAYTEGLSLEVIGKGLGYGESDGPLIQFTMGTPFVKDNETVQPFVGIGTNLAAEGSFYNGSQLGSIWFKYRTSGFDELLVEVHDEYATLHDDGEVFYTKLPGTEGGAWKTAEIPLNKLFLPSWAKNRTGASATLDKTKLAKIQFKNQSTKNGSIQIDEVYLLDPSITGVKLLGSNSARVSGLRATYNRGKVGVSWNAASSVASGKIQLVNTKGRVVASAPVAKVAGKITANLGAGSIPTGMYFVRVNAKDVNGKKIVQQTALSIVK
jgi:hypothetical protein